jgi:zinc transport system ATP-binding protein
MSPKIPRDKEILVEATDISVRFKRGEVLTNVDLQVRRGEIVTIIGPNGAGKTTLLRVVLGLLTPSTGRIRRSPSLRIGYMPQRMTIDNTFPLTVKKFLSLASRTSRARIPEVLGQVGALRTLDSPMQGLSGGEMQRVLLARALLRRPDLLVLDEPAQGVDVQGQSDLFQLITRLRDALACAVLMVSHDLHLVMSSTDQVVCLNRHVCCHGPPDTVSASPGYLELFSPQVASTLAVYSHQHDHRHDHGIHHPWPAPEERED